MFIPGKKLRRFQKKVEEIPGKKLRISVFWCALAWDNVLKIRRRGMR